MTDYSDITTALISGDAETLCSLVQASLDQGSNPGEILSSELIKGMDIVGGKMQSGEMFIPEVLMSAMSMSKAVEILKPLLGEDDNISAGHIVVGTVKGDLHDIGKNLVSMMVASSGFEVTDLGVDVAPETFVKAAQENNATVVALSALLTTTMPMMKKTIDAIRESSLGNTVKILVGGAPVTQAFADEIGADGYAADAGSATKLAKSFV
jgi:5-methyltetrahydrofolate--homocysteine methyltransferase